VFGLDDLIASYSDGTGLLLVSLVAILLGLRHATDPDHLAAVTALVAGGRERAGRTAARLGLAWGAGHALTLFAFGVPIVVFGRYLPQGVQQAAETAVAALIVYLAVRLLFRWRSGFFHVHEHEHGGRAHAHLHAHDRSAAHRHAHRGRSALGAFGIGLLHGMGGSAGVGVLIVATVESTALSLVALGLLAVFTAVSMTVLTTGLGAALDARPVRRAFGAFAPGVGALSLAFGVWYASAAWALAPYPF
jgi:ABC-type nickel/cobalt efflux system permease component RcnA